MTIDGVGVGVGVTRIETGQAWEKIEYKTSSIDFNVSATRL